MLIYDQALDPYHTAIRILAVTSAAEKRKVKLSVDAVRIADYFLVFPFKMIDFTFPAEFRYVRTAVKETESPYRTAPGMRAAFERMRPIFFAAASGLVAAGFLSESAFKTGTVERTKKDIPTDLAAALNRFVERQNVVGKYVLSDLLDMPANGNHGLKHRSRLLEHRYDIA